MRRFTVILPILFAIAGLAYLGAVATGGDDGPSGAFRPPTKAEARQFHYIPELGANARKVPGTSGIWEVKFKDGTKAKTHLHNKDMSLLQIEDRVKNVGPKSGLGKALTSEYTSGDPEELMKDPPPSEDWNWTGRAGGELGPNSDSVSGASKNCTQSGARVEFIYLHPPTWNRHAEIQAGVNQMVSAFSSAASLISWKHGGPAVANLNVECSGGNVTVYDVELPTPPDRLKECESEGGTCYWRRKDLNLTTSQLSEIVKKKGYDGKGSRYMMMWDGILNGDNRASAYIGSGASGNSWAGINLEPYHSDPWDAFFHEGLHTMGAIDAGAPHENGAGHCTDGIDIMCYSESGDIPQDEQCGANVPAWIDCNGDDYFNPLPKPGSWLSANWNIGNKKNGMFKYEGKDRCKWTGVKTTTSGILWWQTKTYSGGSLECAAGTSRAAAAATVALDEARSAPVGERQKSAEVENVPVG